MKQRALTEIQLNVIRLKQAGKTNDEIAGALAIHPDTVSKKYSAILKGINKGSYNNLPHDLCMPGDLFKDL